MLQLYDSSTLSGYGGRSELRVVNMPKFGQHESLYYHIVHADCSAETTLISAVVGNHGNQVAFVNAFTFQDWSGSSRVNSELLKIEPSAFCVKPNHQQEVLIELRLGSRDSLTESSVFFYYGDNISRLKYCRAIQQGIASAPQLPTNHPLSDVDFCAFYVGENPSEDVANVCRDDIERFLTSIMKVSEGLCVTLCHTTAALGYTLNLSMTYLATSRILRLTNRQLRSACASA